MTTLTIPILEIAQATCKVCGFTWRPRSPFPAKCYKCQSPFWWRDDAPVRKPSRNGKS